jgi:hypothetical protein
MKGEELHKPKAVYVVYMAASIQVWGAHCTHLNAQGIWSLQEQSIHINFLELKTVHLALKAFAKTLVNKPIQIATTLLL